MILKNARHERFCQEIARGKTADEAYKLAGFKPNRGNASTLKSNKNISTRVAEILALASQKTEVTLESLQRDAADILRLALAQGQLSAANGALKLMAVFAGLYVEKAENTNRSVDPAALPDDKLADIACRDGAAAAPFVPPLDPAPREADEQLN